MSRKNAWQSILTYGILFSTVVGIILIVEMCLNAQRTASPGTAVELIGRHDKQNLGALALIQSEASGDWQETWSAFIKSLGKFYQL